ncbi:hypothetical protein ACFWPU_01220 [Streptomyces sp. NPDC058471]|uniref:hypothetical protein n=1 Tax=Streptomyces sp. NPDC058471 TaxID=3346516 RepID=UPI00364CFE9B
MTTHKQWNNPTTTTDTDTPATPRKSRRIFLWVFLAIQALFVVWIVTGSAGSSGTPSDCGTLDAQTCNDAEQAGTAIGVGIVIALWAATDIILGITYAVYRLARRSRV